MIIRNLLVFAAVLTMNAGVVLAVSGDARAPGRPSVLDEQQQCPSFNQALIQVEQFRGILLENHEKSAFEIAREKNKRYGVKMPLRQGSMGNADFKSWIDIDMDTYPSLGCLVLEKIKVKIEVNNKIEIASDFGKETCLYSEFFNLETELMQQDEEIINEEVIKLREFLKANFGGNNVFAATPGVNIDWIKEEKAKALKELINNHIAKIKEKIFEERKKSDLPEFFDDIQNDCAGYTPGFEPPY